MESKFEFGAAEKLFEKIQQDESGKLIEAINNVVYLCRDISQMEVPMDELAVICSLGWYMGKDPEVQNIFEFLKMTSKQTTDIIN